LTDIVLTVEVTYYFKNRNLSKNLGGMILDLWSIIKQNGQQTKTKVSTEEEEEEERRKYSCGGL